MTVNVLPASKDNNEVDVAGAEALDAENSVDGNSMDSEYVEITVPTYNYYPTNSQSPLCVISSEFFQQNLSAEQLEQFNIDAFPVNKLVTTVDGIEQWRADDNGDITWASDKPYLISTSSLKLKTIANRIRRSRDYSPLLHVGWRQVGETKRRARAVRLFAGDNADLQYKQALAEKVVQQKSSELNEILAKRLHAEDPITNSLSPDSLSKELTTTAQVNAVTTIIDELSIADELSTSDEQRQQAKQQQLDKLFQQFSLLNEHETKLETKFETSIEDKAVESIVKNLTSDINENKVIIAGDILEESTITAPLQPWYLDGLFKVHLNHFLYINSEFNMVEPMSLAKNDKTINSNNIDKTEQVISFKQNRRVITGEIHYFDHPQMGMVVQIRRFDPTKPAAEAVSQAKK
jgi:hypothetical protein